MDQIKIGNFISNKRKNKNLTQRQLADMLNISDKTVSKWETGKGLPDVTLMIPLCNILGISVNELLLGEHIIENDYKSIAEQNLVNLLKRHYWQMLYMIVISVLSTVFILSLGGYLSLRVNVAQSTWLGNAQIDFDGGIFMAETLLFLVFALIFGVLQMIISKKLNNIIIKNIPLGLSVFGLLFCLVTYLGIFGTSSPSVVAENQYFALFLCIPIGGAFVGCLLGILFTKIVENKY